MERSDQSEALSAVEHIKAGSRYLRGTIEEGLAEQVTGAISDDDSQLTKFHGIYLYDDRDLRLERQEQKLEPLYRFMVRVRVPGGICTAKQWLALDAVAREHGNGTLRLTTRQAVQFHGIIKRDLKASVASINASLLDTIAACGDVNRNVLCSPLPERSRIHAAAYGWVKRISEHLTPRTSAYHEIWLNGEQVAENVEDTEPIYGHTYLPRKFKIALVVPPVNDVDVFAHDLGLIAIVRNGRLTGFNIAVGGGLGMSHTKPETYPRLANVIGSCAPKQVVAVAEAIVTTQRDFGNRNHRHLSRLKYTIEEYGLEWFVAEIEQCLGFALGPAAEFSFDHTGDRFGWTQSEDGKSHLTLAIPNGRVEDRGDNQWMTGLRELA
ncbi:MAG: NADPH-dependent assimilatory sulfite reductase hemoprotein subunit, partial [bacterium]|nr:NADPH-dependent assimilatory sulfite reductase hemoprotein subunit [bacterium]